MDLPTHRKYKSLIHKRTQYYIQFLLQRKFYTGICIFIIIYLFFGSTLTNNNVKPIKKQPGIDADGDGYIDMLLDDTQYHLPIIPSSIINQKQLQETKSLFPSLLFRQPSSFHTLKLSTVLLQTSTNDLPPKINSTILNLASKLKVKISTTSSSEKLNQLSRYTLCSTMASNDYCYFQDDTTHNIYLDTLYLNFLRYPSLIHAVIPSSRYMEYQKWRFYNDENHMHTGYADLTFGAIVPRWKVQHFLTQLGKSGLGKVRLLEADAYFSIWANQYPWLLSNQLDTVMNIQPHSGDKRRMIYDAIKRLDRALSSDTTTQPKDYIERVEEMPPMHQRDTKSSCKNDQCLFISSLNDVFPLIDMPSFSREKYNGPKDWDAKINTTFSEGFPTNYRWMKDHNYQFAVDEDISTCWKSTALPQKDDYFGLVTMNNQLPTSVSIFVDSEFNTITTSTFTFSLLRNQTDWVPCQSTLLVSNQMQGTKFNLDCLSSNKKYTIESDITEKDQYIHALKISFNENWTNPLYLCGISINSLTV
ncbi:unnamed protein product [Cunninghamella blakesleeana]